MDMASSAIICLLVYPARADLQSAYQYNKMKKANGHIKGTNALIANSREQV
jgi:hypothetical protein